MKSLKARLSFVSVSLVAAFVFASCNGDPASSDETDGGAGEHSDGSGGRSEGAGGQGGAAIGGGSGDGGIGAAGGAGEKGPLFAIAAERESPEGLDMLYVDTVSDLGGSFDPTMTGIEQASASTFKFLEGQVFVGQNETPTITKYVLDDEDRLVMAGSINFSGVGASSAYDYTVISPTKAYLYDMSNYVAHVWDPSTMELTGVEIDFGGAFHEDRPPIYLDTERLWTVQRGDDLFIPGGWWGDDPYPAALVLAFDTNSDTVKVLEREDCTFLDTGILTSEGDIIFFSNAYGLVSLGMPVCTPVIRAGKVAFEDDDAFDLDELLDGRVASEVYQGEDGTAYALVTEETRPEIDENLDLLFNGNHKTFWILNLSEGTAKESTAVAPFNDARRSFDLGDGRVVANVHWLIDPEDPVGELETTVYQLKKDGPVEFEIGIQSNLVLTRLAEIGRLR